MKLLSTVLFLLALPLAVSAAPISFKNLPTGDWIEITYASSGCFHNSRYLFVFQRALTTTVAISELRIAGKRPGDNHVARVPLGTVELSNEQIAGLDRLFVFYRALEEPACTTVDTINAFHKSGNQILASEKFVDGSCGTYDKSDLTLLSALATQVEQAGELQKGE